MKPNDLDKYVSRLNEIMENSHPKISTSENLEVSPELKARIKKISLENSKVKKKGRIIIFKKKAYSTLFWKKYKCSKRSFKWSCNKCSNSRCRGTKA